MRHTKLIAFALLTLILLIIAFQNLTVTEVHLLFMTVSMPQAALLTTTLLIGFLMGLFASALWQVRAWRARAQAKKKTREETSAANDQG